MLQHRGEGRRRTSNRYYTPSADETGSVRFVDSLLKVRGFLVELAPNVDVGGCSVQSTTGDKAALYKFMRIPAKNFSFFAGTRFPFAGLDYEGTTSKQGLDEQ
jgi:hypothetical protein